MVRVTLAVVLLALVACMRPVRRYEGRVTTKLDARHARIEVGPMNLRVHERVGIYRRHCNLPPRPRRCMDIRIADAEIVDAVDDWHFIVVLSAPEEVQPNDIVKRPSQPDS